jgi:hypothetical protein
VRGAEAGAEDLPFSKQLLELEAERVREMQAR